MLKLTMTGVALLIAVILGPLLWTMSGDQPAPDTRPMLPWQIEITDEGESRVFGLLIGRSVLDDARALFGPDIDVAIIAPPGQPALLEAYLESITAGFITGRLILTLEVDSQTIAEMRDRALKEAYMESVTRKITLAPNDLATARQTPIRAITFIPSADLDADVIIQRFGEPAMRIRIADELEHFLYPDRGLDIALSSRGKEVFQYVSPRDFALIANPLIAADAAVKED
jgi:hypothetical protein